MDKTIFKHNDVTIMNGYNLHVDYTLTCNILIMKLDISSRPNIRIHVLEYVALRFSPAW